jgi:hypothetical protein
MEEPQPDGAYRLISENVVTNLQVGEPDSRYFDVPMGYEKLTPSEFKSEHASWSTEKTK